MLVGNLGADCRSDGIGQLARVINIGQVYSGVLTQLLVELHIFAELFDHLPHQRGDFAARNCVGIDKIDFGDDV